MRIEDMTMTEKLICIRDMIEHNELLVIDFEPNIHDDITACFNGDKSKVILTVRR